MHALPSTAALADLLENFRAVWKMATRETKPVVFDAAWRSVRTHYRFQWSSHRLEQELLALLFITGHVQASSYTVATEANEAWAREAQSPVCLPRPPLGKRYRISFRHDPINSETNTTSKDYRYA